MSLNYTKQALQVIDSVINRKGYACCELCGNNGAGKRLHVHHICFRSEAPNHPQMHNIDNLILICHTCHETMHSTKEKRIPLVIERELWKLFPELFNQFKDYAKN